MELNEYQRLAAATDQRPGKDEQSLVFPLMGLASEVGSLVNQYKKRVRDGDAHELFSARVGEELGDILWYTANLAGKLDHRLEDIAALNLMRISQRWPTQDSPDAVQPLDSGFLENERLPTTLTVRFIQTMEKGRPRVRLYLGDTILGDPLSDMAWEGDDYRFHDAFHLTYAALLGWSPIVRAMLGKQRESNAVFREIEDSGRAKVVEEAIAAVVFEYARKQRFLVGIDHLDFSLLETVLGIASLYEVRVRSAKEWETTILESFRVWNRLRDQQGGVVHLDLAMRTIVVDQIA